MIKQHLEYRIDDNDNVTIWRYLDFKKLDSLLSKNVLYLRRSDKFDDDHEGTYSDSAILDRPRFYESDSDGHFLKTGLPQMHQTWGKCTYVNCWYASNHESLAMWKLYNGCVAIKSSISGLKESIISDKEFCLGFVSYIDYVRDQMSQANAFSPFFHKQKAYEHEKEFRILTLLNENITNVHNKTLIPPDGLLINVDVDVLIHSIVISPLANNEERADVGELLNKFELLNKLESSSLERIPRF